jgi:hypothetical protein
MSTQLKKAMSHYIFGLIFFAVMSENFSVFPGFYFWDRNYVKIPTGGARTPTPS